MKTSRFLRVAVGLFSIALGLVQVYASRPRYMTRSKTRPCYANQKTVIGAIEMYNLDKNTRRTTLDAAFFRDLHGQGYLTSVPQDPGAGRGSSGNYRTTADGNGITCLRHGPIR